MAYLGKAFFLADLGSQLNVLMTVTRSSKEMLPRLYTTRGTTVSRRIDGVFLAPRAQITRAVFLFNHNAIGEGFYTEFAKPKIVVPTAMAKLAIDSDRLESLVIYREICIPNREICIIL